MGHVIQAPNSLTILLQCYPFPSLLVLVDTEFLKYAILEILK